MASTSRLPRTCFVSMLDKQCSAHITTSRYARRELEYPFIGTRSLEPRSGEDPFYGPQTSGICGVALDEFERHTLGPCIQAIYAE